MERKQYCKACSFARHGVKTRKSIPHTCNSGNPFSPFQTREEYEKAVANLLKAIVKKE